MLTCTKTIQYWNSYETYMCNSCYICLLLIELLPRMLGLWRIICQCKTLNEPIYFLLGAIKFQQSLMNLFRSVSPETQSVVWLTKQKIFQKFLKDREMIFSTFYCLVEIWLSLYRSRNKRIGMGWTHFICHSLCFMCSIVKHS